jgi:voltage-gated potassium channel
VVALCEATGCIGGPILTLRSPEKGRTQGTANYTKMQSPSPVERTERWLDTRTGRKGLRPRDAAYLIVAFWATAVVVFGVVERLVDPRTFHSVWLGMWWAIETVTTVGYGDIVPDQTAGKLIGGFLMLGGLSLLSVITAVITSGFVSRAQSSQQAAKNDPAMQRFDELALQLQAIKTELDRLRAGPSPPNPS